MKIVDFDKTAEFCNRLGRLIDDDRGVMVDLVEVARQETDASTEALEEHRANRPPWRKPLSRWRWAKEESHLKSWVDIHTDKLEKLQEQVNSPQSVCSAYKNALMKLSAIEPELYNAHQARKASPINGATVFEYLHLKISFDTFHMGQAAKKLADQREILKKMYRNRQRHEADKPGTLKNILTLGIAGRVWSQDHTRITEAIDDHEHRFRRIYSAASGSDAPKIAEYKAIASIHRLLPELTKAFQQEIEAINIDKDDPTERYEALLHIHKLEIMDETVAAFYNAEAYMESLEADIDRIRKCEPSRWQNLKSLGRAGREWKHAFAAASDRIIDATSAVDTARNQWKELDAPAPDRPNVTVYHQKAVDRLAATHPDVLHQYQATLDEQWRTNNQARLQKCSQQSAVEHREIELQQSIALAR